MVVVQHALNPRRWLFSPFGDYDAMAAGVDIFFVISGFIMQYVSSTERPGIFLKKRIVRIVPLYWLGTLSYCLINYHWDSKDFKAVHISSLLKSLFFVPHHSLEYPSAISPILLVGWTLNYEVFFYMLFGIGLYFRRSLEVCTVGLVLLVVSGLIHPSPDPLVTAYTDFRMLEFVFGMWIALAYRSGRISEIPKLLLPCALISLTFIPLVLKDAFAVSATILCSSAIVAGALRLEENLPEIRPLKLLGDASYSIYLTHLFVLKWVIPPVWARVPVRGWGQFAGWMVLSLSMSILLGIVVHRLVEKPMLNWFRGRRLIPGR